MSDRTDEKAQYDRLKVTSRQFQDYLERTGFKGDCRICGKDDWTFPLAPGFADGDENGMVQLAGLPGLGITGSLPVHTLICTNCGHIELISALHITEKVKGHE